MGGSTMKWIDEYFEEIILVLLLAAMTLIMGVQVVARYVFSNSLSWSEELVRFMFVWSGFLGIPYCIKHQSSIAVELIKMKLPEGVQTILDYVIFAIETAVAALMLGYGYQVVAATFTSGQISPALGVPMYIVQASVMISAFLSLLRIAQCVMNYENVKEKRKRNFVLDELHGLEDK